MKCIDCGKVVDSDIDFDTDNFKIYCPDCVIKNNVIVKEIDKIYKKKPPFLRAHSLIF